jgi:Pyridine nucleotide-disulphide oxidoreductase, dimerisation domain/Pyridine nucleotide-disulphide oxidoreductase
LPISLFDSTHFLFFFRSPPRQRLKRLHHLGRCLHQLNQYALTRNRKFVIRLGVQEGDVKTRSTFADAAGGEAHAVGAEPLHRGGQVVDPQAHVVERGSVNGGFLLQVERLHQVTLKGPLPADKAGVAVTDRGFINVDIQMRTNVPHIFAIGDIVGQPMLAHKAVHEAHVAAEVIAGELQGNKELAAAAFNARVIPSVAYTDPEVAWVGLTEDQAKAQGIKVKKGLFPWTASGRAIANGRDEGFTKLLFDDSPEAHGHGKILGGGMVGTHAGDMIGEIALAIEMGADAVDIGKTIHPHPTLGESIGMAAEVAHGSCTDLPPSKR